MTGALKSRLTGHGRDGLLSSEGRAVMMALGGPNRVLGGHVGGHGLLRDRPAGVDEVVVNSGRAVGPS
jgi:hypothetical protein